MVISKLIMLTILEHVKLRRLLMLGSNEFIFNEATIIVAMQEYIDKRITVDTPKVTSVSIHDRTNNLFSIKLEEQNVNKANT